MSELHEQITDILGFRYEGPESYDDQVADEILALVNPRITYLEAENAELRGVVENMIGLLPHISGESGICQCGDDMDHHFDSMFSGHSPVDSGLYAIDRWQEHARTLLAKVTEKERP